MPGHRTDGAGGGVPGRTPRAGRLRGGTRMPLILMYHSVAPYTDDPHHITVTPRRLDQQLRLLRRAGLRGVAVADLLSAVAAGRAHGLVGLSFDDGYADFADHALPLLLRHGCTATVYAISGRLGGHNVWDEPAPRKELLTAAALREVADAGMEVGCHSRTHVRLPGLDDAALRRQTADARAELSDALGREVTGFCYPYGAVDARAVAAVEDAGFDYACAIWRSAHTGRHALPRAYVGDRDGMLRMLARRARHRMVNRGDHAAVLTARRTGTAAPAAALSEEGPSGRGPSDAGRG